jgi:hypothetical protein
MNLKSMFHPIVSSLLSLGLAAGLAGSTTASAQSMNVTAPFAFCVGNQVFTKGTYQFSVVSPWLLSIRGPHGQGEKLFAVRPEDGPARGSLGLTFHRSQGMRELEAVHAPGAYETVVLLGPGPKHPLAGCGGAEPGSKSFSQRASASDPSHITIGTNEHGSGRSNGTQ